MSANTRTPDHPFTAGSNIVFTLKTGIHNLHRNIHITFCTYSSINRSTSALLSPGSCTMQRAFSYTLQVLFASGSKSQVDWSSGLPQINCERLTQSILGSTLSNLTIFDWFHMNHMSGPGSKWRGRLEQVGLKIENQEIHQNLQNPVSINRPIVSETCLNQWCQMPTLSDPYWHADAGIHGLLMRLKSLQV